MNESRQPVIAMTMWRRPLPTYLGEKTELFTLGTEYVQSLERQGATVVLIPGTGAPSEILARVDGLVLSGGEDIHPDNWGGQPDDDQMYDPLRDARELALYRLAREAKLPVLGICRGLQLIAVAEGIPLIADIPTSPAHPGQSTPEELLGHRHQVTFDPGSRLAGVYGQTERLTNSIHHQAISAAPAGFRATAWASDGTIEAIESDDGLVTAVQWHPEKMTGPGEVAAENVLFESFSSLCSLSTPNTLSERTAHL